MCVIARRTYLYPDGRRRTVETTTRCERAVGPQPCRDVVTRVARGVEVVENAASTDRTPADGIYVRERVTHPDSDLSSASRSTRRSHTSSERSPVTAPSSASSLSFPEPTTGSARLSPVIEAIPPSEQSRRPYAPSPPTPAAPPPPDSITADGTAQYSRPPLGIEQAVEVEHPFRLVENTSEGETTGYPIRDTGTIPGRVSRRSRAPVRHEITTPNSARILSTNETTENNSSATSLPATSLTPWSQHRPNDATERLAISPRKYATTLDAEDEQHLISVFVQDLRAALNARFGRVPETRGVKRSIAALLETYTILLERFQNPGNLLERCAVDFVLYRREQVYALK